MRQPPREKQSIDSGRQMVIEEVAMYQEEPRDKVLDVRGDADVVDFSTPDTAWRTRASASGPRFHCVMGTIGAHFSELDGVRDANLFAA
jgi:dihydrodipicolinate reductase